MKRPKLARTITLADDPLWYKDAIIYELHVRAFADSNGDGIGDFRGLMGKLDYLQDLGITALWLLPFYPSPLRDDGYDIADYTNVNPAYGTLADFQAFLKEAHRRGLRVITELVLNHTSDQHPWFQRARRAPAGSPERNFYVWTDDPNKYHEARIIFKDFEPSNWTWDPVAGAYFWHRFYAHQPDLNYDNPEVHQATFEVLDFWLSMGIDGLRLDAVPYLYEREGTNCENLPETHSYLKKLRRHIDEKFPNRMLLAEANQWPEDAVAYFGQGDECHMDFHFPLMPRLFMALRMEDRFPIIDILQQTPAIPESCQWALFLRNHDELTLEMVTDEDRDYMYRLYAQDPQARINLGIRRRLAPLLENHRGKIELLNALLMALPGTPVIYYGDEIGMGDNIYLGDRNGVRTPMQWNAERNAGFSRANPQRLYLPVIIDPEYHFEAVNVETQQNNPHSFLWWIKRLIALRKQYRAFGRGSFDFLPADNPKVLAFVRRYQDEVVVVVVNLSRFPQFVTVDLSGFQGMVPVEMLGRTPFPPIGPQPYVLTLGSHAFYWFSLQPQAVDITAPSPDGELATLAVTGRWEEVFRDQARQDLEEILPTYLKRCPWFQEKARQTEAAMILETVPVALDGSVAQLALIQVEYSEADAETYLLPLAFAAGQRAEAVQTGQPGAVVAHLDVQPRDGKRDGEVAAGESGVLFDPVGDKEFAGVLLEAFHERRRFKGSGGELLAAPLPPFEELLAAAQGLPEPSLRRADLSHSSVALGDRFMLKVFRRVEEGSHPEAEVGRFLAEKTSFRNFPPVAGTLDYQRGWGGPLTLAVLEGFIPNESDGWRYTRDALGRYYEQALIRSGQAHELPQPRVPLQDLAEQEIPAEAREYLGAYLETAQLMGQRTGEFHVALATPAGDPSFTPEPFGTLYQRSMYQSLRNQARRALELLRKRLGSLPEAVAGPARKLLDQEEELLRRGRQIFERKITAMRTRCHGDYHLSQLLFTGKDFIIKGLEGDIHRPLSDRRRKRSPLRDVASMLRSFHYAAFLASAQGGIRPEDLPTLEPWKHFWLLWVAVAFLKAYLAVVRPAALLPQDHGELGTLLYFYLLKRTAFELEYELRHHPDQARVPIEGLLRLLEIRERVS